MPAKKTKRVSVGNDAGIIKPVQAARPAAKKSGAMLYAYWIAIAALAAAACYVLSMAGKKGRRADNVQIVESAAPVPAAAPAQGALPAAEPVSAAPAPDFADAGRYAESGKNKLIDGDNVGALNDFTIAIEKNPSAENYIFRGEVLMSGSNFDAAIGDFDAAIGIDPAAVAAYYDRSLANIKLEKLQDAKSDLDRAIGAAALRPNDQAVTAHDIYAKRAQVNLWIRNWADAESDYTAAIANTAGDLDYNDYTGRAEARTNRGDYESAIADYVSAVTIISDKIQKTPDEKSRENISRQAMNFFEKSGALRVKVGQMDLALQDLKAAHMLAIALDDMENKSRLEILIQSIR